MFDQEPHIASGADVAVDDRPRTLDEAKNWMIDRARKRVHPMNNTSLHDVEAVLDGLDGLDPVRWASAWRTAGERAWKEAVDTEEPGARRDAFLRAQGLFFMGRFPCPNHPDKLACAERERDAYLAAGELMDPVIERITVPFDENGGGSEVVFYLRRPPGVIDPPVVLMWGGVDAWKEQLTAATDLALSHGVATIALDGPGTGESPVKGVPDGWKQFIPVMDWAAAQQDLNGERVGLVGRSFGGYWATKLAYEVPDRIAGAVNWGGGAHSMFQREWIEKSRHPDSYLMELSETRMRMLGADDDDEYIASFARLSLLDQGILDNRSAPLLLVNGREDRQCPVADIDLLVGHGSPKTVRMFPGGHMGITPHTLPTIIDWVCDATKGAVRS